MGANVTFRVKVLRLVEDEVEVSALTASDALHEAACLEGVAHVVQVVYDDQDR